MEEQEVIKGFKEALSLYPFKVRLIEEYYIPVGRVDLYLEDYNVFIEAKGERGDIKKAIGQCLCYRESGDKFSYIIAPRNKITQQYYNVCCSNDIGLLVIEPSNRIIRVANDVGGMDSFSFARRNMKFNTESIQTGQDYNTEWVLGCGESEVVP